MSEESKSEKPRGIPAIKPRAASPFREVVLGAPPGAADLIKQATADPGRQSQDRTPEPAALPVAETAPAGVAAFAPPPLEVEAPAAAGRPSTVAKRRIGKARKPKKVDAAAETDLIRIQAAIPYEVWLRFKYHCGRNRTTASDEIRSMIERVVAKQPA